MLAKAAFVTLDAVLYHGASRSYYSRMKACPYLAGHEVFIRSGERWGRSMEQAETPLDMARRYVAEGEERCTRLTHLLETMEAQNPPQATEPVQRLLAVLDRTLIIMREHVRQEEELRR